MLRETIKQFVITNQGVRQFYNKGVNNYASGSRFIRSDNTGFKGNRINIKDQGSSFSLGKNSFTKKCGIVFFGKNNHVRIAESTQIYGSKGNGFHIEGNSNTIVIGANTVIRDTSFYICGNGNTIRIGDNCSFMLGQFHVEGDHNCIELGEGVTIHGRDGGAVHMATDEGSQILIGDDCMFSNDIQIRSTDSHSILNKLGERINPAKDVVIGNHCWIGIRTTILKGTVVGENTIVAAGSILTKAYDTGNCILAGNPATVMKEGVNWDRKYL